MQTNELIFSVMNGLTPRPQGSKNVGRRKNGSHYVYEPKQAELKAWRAAVADAAVEAIMRQDWIMAETPVTVSAVFYFPAPKSDPHRVFAHTAPDTDKLLRAIGDAMTEAGVYKDDKLVVGYDHVRKLCGAPGVDITVTKA